MARMEPMIEINMVAKIRQEISHHDIPKLDCCAEQIGIEHHNKNCKQRDRDADNQPYSRNDQFAQDMTPCFDRQREHQVSFIGQQVFIESLDHDDKGNDKNCNCQQDIDKHCKDGGKLRYLPKRQEQSIDQGKDHQSSIKRKKQVAGCPEFIF